MVLYNFGDGGKVRLRIIESQKYLKWYKRLDRTQRDRIEARLLKIRFMSYFGDMKRLGEISELRFKVGLRVYFTLEGNELVLLLNGGGKNSKGDQSRDINLAKKIYQEYRNGKPI